ncbi:hypothetical protein GCM10023324_57960 [Streptomyces youssoufiensis]
MARLAGVSTEYYARLEQGRAGSPSLDVIESLTRTLQLDLAEREHFADLLARPRLAVPLRGPSESAPACTSCSTPWTTSPPSSLVGAPTYWPLTGWHAKC